MYTLDSFTTDMQTILLIPEHIRAFSGRSAIGKRDGTVTGVSRFFCPPLTAENLSLGLNIHVTSHGVTVTDDAKTGHGISTQLKLQAEKYHPSYIWRKGVVHEHIASQKNLSLAIETWAVPSALDDSFFLRLQIKNLDDEPVTLQLVPALKSCSFGLASGEWGWDAPCCTDKPAEKLDAGLYKGENAYLSLFWSSDNHRKDNDALRLNGGETKNVILKAAFSQTAFVQAPTNLTAELTESLDKREAEWEEFMSRVPHLHTNHNGLKRAYMHSLLTMFLTTWHSPHFVIDPFYSEAGINGNCLCAYTWGDAYVAKMTALTEKDNYRNQLLAYFGMGLNAHYAFDPVDGKGLGPCYNYNLLAIFTAIHDYVKYTGDTGFLSCSVDGMPLYKRLVQLIDEMEGHLETCGALLDYQNHHNLLEMRGSGYEHFVPSPNGERVFIYNYMADILKQFGHDGESQIFREKAEAVKKDFAQKLWDEKNMWPKCLYPDMHEETVFTIQAFDLLNMGILSPEQEEAILSRINEDEFLSDYGVHSVSKQDVFHFDLGDVDWSGAGAFTGDPCNLVEVLFNMNMPELAWDVAKRLFWWADAYPYWPQSLWAGKREYSHWEQPINRSSFAFAQAIVFGMFGLEVKDGQVRFHPQIPSELGDAELSNVKLFGKVYSTK